MPPIKHTQLFDFPAYTQAIRDVKQESVEFGKAMDEVLKRLKKDQKEVTIGLKEYADVLKSFNITQNNAAEKLKKFNAEIDENITRQTQLKSVMASLDSVFTVQKATVQNITAEYRELRKEFNALRPGQRNFAEDQEKIKAKVVAATAAIAANGTALKNAKQSIVYAEGSYKQLQQQLGNLRTRLRELPDAFDKLSGKLNKNNKEAVDLSDQIRVLDGTLKRADAQMGLFFRNVGNYPSAFKALGSGIKGLLGNIGLLIGVNSAFEGLNFIVTQNKQFESLNNAIKLVSGSEEQFARNQAYLAKTADDLGLEIIGLTQSYKTFYAASTAANIPASQTNEIFGQIAKVAANLKLSQDDVNGVYIAFGQILSKGTVQAEELRGQIGERVPGAFAIAAKAMGVTTAELNKLLKDGKVLANDFLPKFSAELEKTFGKVDKIDSLQASINRFQNALKRLVTDESGALSQFFSSIISGATDFLEFLNGATKSTDQLVEEFRRAQSVAENYSDTLVPLISTYDTLTGKQTRSKDEQELLNDTIQQIQSIVPGAVSGLDEYGRALDINRDKVFQFIDAQNKIAAASRQDALKKATSDLQQAFGEIQRINANISRGFYMEANTEVRGAAASSRTTTTRRDLFTPEGGRTEFGELIQKDLERQQIALNKALFQVQELNGKLPEEVLNYVKATQGVKFEKFARLQELQTQLADVENKITARVLDLQVSTDKDQSKVLEKRIEELIKQRDNIRKLIDQINNPRIDPTTGATSGSSTADKKFKDAIAQQQKMLEAAMELELKKDELRLAKKEIKERTFQENKLRLIEKYVQDAIALEMKLGKNADQGRIADFQKRLATQQLEYEKYLNKQAEIDKERSRLKVGLADIDSPATPTADKLKASLDKRLQATIDAENKVFEIIRAGRDTNFREEMEHLERLKRIRLQYKQSTAEEEYAIARLNAERERQLRQETETFIFDAISTGFQILNEQANASFDVRISKLEEERERELKLAGNNAAAKEKIEREYNQRLAREKRKQAQSDKMYSLFNVAINTAQGVAKTIAQWGMPFALPFIALTVGQGLLQAALIASRPIPAYRKGTKSAQRGLALTGEEGFELIERNGKMFMTGDGPTLVNMQGGEKVYTHEESTRLFKQAIKAQEEKQLAEEFLMHAALASQLRKAKQQDDVQALAQAMSRTGVSSHEMERIMDNAMRKITVERNIWDERGYRKRVEELNQTTTYLNNRYSL